jgi:hypothetical protein
VVSSLGIFSQLWCAYLLSTVLLESIYRISYTIMTLGPILKQILIFWSIFGQRSISHVHKVGRLQITVLLKQEVLFGLNVDCISGRLMLIANKRIIHALFFDLRSVGRGLCMTKGLLNFRVQSFLGSIKLPDLALHFLVVKFDLLGSLC